VSSAGPGCFALIGAATARMAGAAVAFFVCVRDNPRARNRGRYFLSKLIVLGFLIIATTLEANGDAILRMGLNQHAMGPRALLFLAGAGLLLDTV
jgi:hypothetical protein